MCSLAPVHVVSLVEFGELGMRIWSFVVVVVLALVQLWAAGFAGE